MSKRLKIGSYVIDSAASGSTSTTQGVRLLTERPGIRWGEGRTTATLIVPILVSRDTLANFKTSRDALVAALTRTVNADIVYEHEAGQTIKDWLVSTGAWQKIECNVEADEVDNGNEVNALILATFTISRVAPSSGSAGDPDGVLDGVEWDFTGEASGRCGGVIGIAYFDTRAHAAAWVQTIRSGTGWPDWVSTDKARFATYSYKLPQQPNQPDPVPDSAYTPVPAVVYLTILPDAWASSGAFDDVIDGDCSLSLRSRGRLQSEAAARPGLEVLFSGHLQFKVDTAEEFDAGDTSFTAPGALKEKALACIEVMKSDLEQRRGVTFEYIDDVDLNPTGRSGEMRFTVVGLAEFDGIFEYANDVVFESTPRDRILTGSLGDVVFRSKLGPMLRCLQTGAARATYAIDPAPPPFIDDTWFNELWRTRAPKTYPPHGEGMTFYESSWEGRWLKLATANAGGLGGQFNEAGYFIPTSPDV